MQAISWVLEESQSTLGARLVLLSIANHCDKYGTDSWPKIHTIAEESRLSLREVSYAIKTLQEIGELHVVKGQGEIGRNRYTLAKMYANFAGRLPAEFAGTPANFAGESTPLPAEFAGTSTPLPANFAGLTCKIRHDNKEEPSYRPIEPYLLLTSDPEPKLKTFKKPSLEEIRSYCFERRNHVSPEKFFAHYESNGWRVGRNPMKNWKAAVHTWEHNSGGNGNGTVQESAAEARSRRNREGFERLRREMSAGV